jgi:hypothetical protein
VVLRHREDRQQWEGGDHRPGHQQMVARQGIVDGVMLNRIRRRPGRPSGAAQR